MITVYGIANCDKIRKTRKWLDSREIDHNFHDYRKDGLDRALVDTLLQAFSWQSLINQRGTTWRQLPPERKDSLNEDSARELIMKYPTLIKRPLIRSGDEWLLGHDENTFENRLNR